MSVAETAVGCLLVDVDKLIEIEATSESMAGLYAEFLNKVRFGFDNEDDWVGFYTQFLTATMRPAFISENGNGNVNEWVEAAFVRFLKGTRGEMKRDLIEGYEDIPEMILTMRRIRDHYTSVHRWLYPYRNVSSEGESHTYDRFERYEYVARYREALHGIYSYGNHGGGSSYPAWIHNVLRDLCDRAYIKLKDIAVVPLNILLITFASTLKIFFERVRQNKCTRKGWAIHAKVLGKLHWLWSDTKTIGNTIDAAKLTQEGVGTDVGVKERIIGIIKDEDDDRVAFLEVMELIGETLRKE